MRSNERLFVLQAKEEMKAAKAVYERINAELKDELPVLHDRSDTFLRAFQSLRVNDR